MILNCNNCGSSLRYDPETDKLFCAHCSSYHELSKFNGVEAEGDEFEGKVCTCRACGARLMLNGTEAATFCVFCGQPTLVSGQLFKMKKPKCILPFSISKEQALSRIKAQIRKGRYIPDEIKNMEPEEIRGVYIPFVLYNLDYSDRQLIERTILDTADKYNAYLQQYFYREASCNFAHVLLDASTAFNDESAKRLRPFDLRALKPFHPGYLSGYYADCMDEDDAKLEKVAGARCAGPFDAAVLRSISWGNFTSWLVSMDSNNVEKKIIKCDPTVKVRSADRMLFPVWFAVFRAEDKHYTVMVNGQTGKVVGAFPSDERKVKRRVTLYSVILAVLLGGGLGGALWYFDSLKISCISLFSTGILSILLHLRLKRKFIEYRLSSCLAGVLSNKNMGGRRE